MKFHVPEMSCGHCTAAIEKSIKTKDSAAVVSADLETRLVTVRSTLHPADIQEAIATSGYEVKVA